MPPSEVNMEILHYRLTKVEENQHRLVAIAETVPLIQETLRATKDTIEKLGHWIEAVDHRTQVLEIAAPMSKFVERLMMTGVLGVLSLVGMGFYGMYDTYRFNAQAGQQWPQSAPADAGRKP